MEKTNLKKKFLFNAVSIILILVFCFFAVPKEFQNDTFYTIKIGETISENGIDMQDHFSQHENLSYTYPHWLYDLITFKVFSLGKFTALYIMTIILCMILGLSIYFVTNYKCKNNLIAFISTIFTIMLMSSFITARAQLVTFTLFIFEFYFIEKFLENKKIINIVMLFTIFTLIANLHCAVWPFAFILFLPYIAEELIYCFLKNTEKKTENSKLFASHNSTVKILPLIMILCAFTGLLTPIGTVPYTYLVKTMLGNTTRYISEHQPATLMSDSCLMIYFIYLFFMMIFINKKTKLSDFFMIIGLATLTLLSGRQLSLAVLLTLPIFASKIKEKVLDYKENFDELTNKNMTNGLLYCIMIYFVITLITTCYKTYPKQKYINSAEYPIYACDYILENIDLENLKLYNEYICGAYILYRNIPVFIDSRADLYAPEFNEKDIFMDAKNLSYLSCNYIEKLTEYNITHLLLSKKSHMYYVASANKTNFNLIYEDDNFTIFEFILN